VGVAHTADEKGAVEVARAAFEKAVGLDRNCQAAMLGLTAMEIDAGDKPTARAWLEEAARVAPLAPEVEAFRQQLCADAETAAGLDFYLKTIGRTEFEKAGKPLSIVVVTNLLPPQELGGYGRMMWEFAHGLIARGHRVRVLTANAAEFSKTPTPDEAEMEKHVSRTLQLAGTWVEGRVVTLSDPSEIARRMRDNTARIRTAISKMNADLVLGGNLDLLGINVLRPALDAEIPTLHALANASPGYPVEMQPLESHYWVAPCSDWNAQVFRDAGYTPSRIETLYPGARIDRFFRLALPDPRPLRICYASLVLPYKGAHTLVAALAELHRAGVDFTAEIGGEAPKPEFLNQLKEVVRSTGMESKVRFTGFLDRQGLSALFARSNVLVFPSEFQEPFGISQVEALAAGLVVVSSGTGGAKEIIRDQTDGLLFSAGNASDLAAKLRLLAADTALMRQLQRGSQARALEFSVDAAVRRIESLAAEMKAAIDATKMLDIPALPWN
jgi:glycosyltransferase involved in cell wall biosynthesis